MFAMMDNNENENYCYQKNTKTPGDASKGAIPKATANKYQNQFNNNNNVAEQENLMPQVNGAQVAHDYDFSAIPAVATNSLEVETVENRLNGKSDSATLNESYPCDELAARAAVDSDEGDLDGDFSDNNSLGNLSYISENGLIEEIILLPNNIYSDDENESASDDCIYAYRGDDHVPALLEYRDQPADDETDFLEMDFDPEPSSELENLLEHQDIDVNSFHPARTVERLTLQDNEKSSAKCSNYENDASPNKQKEPPDEASGAAVLDVNVPVETKKTGAIPKKPFAYSQQSSLELRDNELPGPSRSSMKGNSKNLKLDLKLCTDASSRSEFDYRFSYPYYERQRFSTDGDRDNGCCLDCTEKQFLMETKQDLSVQRVCRSCHSRNQSQGMTMGEYLNDLSQSLNASNSETDLMNIRAEQIVLQALNKINELKATPPSVGLSRSMEDMYVDLDSERRDQDMAIDFMQEIYAENTITIYTLNCGELTIIEALTRIGVAPNLDVLRLYFSEQYNVDTSKMSIPMYLLYMSKRDCNIKKLIETIKSCCEEPLDVHYYPLDPHSDTPELVQINSAEIAKRWNENTNLRQIINFKHRHFDRLNVLGKVVNILRLPHKGRHANLTINIPQYYKSGSITITRIT
ncbi:uncharacterized protein LOC131682571 isoform X2 [Topomyia yanbarensis]|uniref:uncharacterized protein LOC131682571 isoform X2 n=1 Tax=Topomyia yanbarensis TaxID=2498891 RepID=UPI00273CAAE0|nr:uncharacterized protein LOC131682571 isoform X2 [Topomyia yanbarensis]